MMTRKGFLIGLCALLLIPALGTAQAQDGCDLASINAEMSVLVAGYIGTQGTAADAEAALNQIDQLNADITALLVRCGRAPSTGGGNPLAGLGSGNGGGAEDPNAETEPADPQIAAAGYVNPANTPGSPLGPAANVQESCVPRTASGNAPATQTNNGVRLRAFLPSGSYKATLLPVRFQTFDPILFVVTSEEGVCVTESDAAREYVVDFSRAGIGGQVFGHRSGGVLEFDVPGSSTELSQVDIFVGGTDGADAGITGEFVLVVEGARLTASNNQHIYNVSITESMFESDVPLGVMVLGKSDVLDPNLQAGAFTSATDFVPLFVCEDGGTAECQSDARGSLEGTSVVEAAVGTTRGDDRDAAILAQPSAFLAGGIVDVSYVVSQQNGTPVRDEYVIVFYGGIG